MTLSATQSVERFIRNEERQHTFVNDVSNAGFYLTEENTPRQVETLPRLVSRIAGLFLAFDLKGDWVSGTTYNAGELVYWSGNYYTATKTFVSTDVLAEVALGKWAPYFNYNSSAHIFSANLPNSVSIPVENRLKDLYPNPEMFGAVGNSLTDDTFALQKLFACGASVVQLTPGKVYNCGRLTIPYSITIFGYGATIKHKSGSSDGGNNLFEMGSTQTTKTLTIYGLTIDGNSTGHTLVGGYSLIHAGSNKLKLYDCRFEFTKGNFVRVGNVLSFMGETFNSAFYSSDLDISNCVFRGHSSNCGGAIIVERTRGNEVNCISDNTIIGGQFGIKAGVYSKKLEITNNFIKGCFGTNDAGLECTMSEYVMISGNVISNCNGYGLVTGALVSATVKCNDCNHNGKAGLHTVEYGAAKYVDAPNYAGSISDRFNSEYSNQTKTSPLVNNIGTIYDGNKSYMNLEPDYNEGSSSDVYHQNYFEADPASESAIHFNVSPGTRGRTKITFKDNIFAPTTKQGTYIYFDVPGYNNDSVCVMNYFGKSAVSRVMPSNIPTEGMFDMNSCNKYLYDKLKIHPDFISEGDDSSISQYSVKVTAPGPTDKLVWVDIYGTAIGATLLQFRILSDAASIQLWAESLASDNQSLGSILSVTNVSVSQSHDYETKNILIPTSTLNGVKIRVFFEIPPTKTIRLNLLSAFKAMQD